MTRTLGRIALFGSAFVLLAFAVLVVNQTAQAVHLAETVHPRFGQIVLWTLLATYGVLLLVPVVLILRLRAPLKAPAPTESQEVHDKHLARLGRRLGRNELLTGQPLETRQDVEAALHLLDQKANATIRQIASTVFVTTAVSQSGRLDGFLVLSVQTRMVWQIARLYWQRPTLREMAYLYGNVAGTVFVAGEIEDMDLEEQVTPLVAAVLGGTAGAVPGFQAIASVFSASILTGAANAFLTLRVGVIARRYCSSLVAQDRRAVRRAAAVEAASMLVAIVQESTTRISKAVFTGAVQAAAKRAATLGAAAYSSGRDVASAVGQAVADAFSWFRRSGPQPPEP